MNPLQNFYDLVDVLKDGKVFLVYDKIGKQLCVFKERNLQTAEIYRHLKKIKNFCVPEIFRVVEFKGKLFVVEEFIEGQTLAEFFSRNNPSEKFVTKILKQLCEGLKILHGEKIIHRDLKPSNIMLTKNNSVKLIDFSISRIMKENSETDTDFLGTRGFAPPEQFGFGQTSPRSDIFSLGITFQKILGENYSGYLKKILSKCTELDPAKRYQSVQEILIDIDKKFFQHKVKKFLFGTSEMIFIISAVLFFPTNIFESELPAEKNIPAEKISVPETKKIPAEKKSEVQPKNFQFPEIKIPEINSESPQKIFELPKSQPEKNPTDPRLNQICTLHLNDKIFSAEIPSEVWKSWRREGDKIFFPANWKLTLKIENKNNFALKNLQAEINFGSDKKIFSATIPSNQSKIFSVPIGNFPVLGGNFQISVRVKSEENFVFSWQGKSFGNYKEFQIYLID